MSGGSGGRSSGRPPFTPHRTFDGPAPFIAEPYGAYEHYLADIDDELETWAQMLTPGASGQALMVTAVNPFICCQQLDLRSAYRAYPNDDEHPGHPLLLPGLVKWRSVIGSNGYVFPGVAEAWKDSMDWPPVGVVDTQFIDCSYLIAACNVVNCDDCVDIDETYNLDDGNWVSGLVAPWQLYPISRGAEELMLEALRKAPGAFNTHVLGITNCELLDTAYESVEGSWFLDVDDDHSYYDHDSLQSAFGVRPFHDGHENCIWTPYRNECPCGEPPTNVQALDGLIEALSRPNEVERLLVPEPLRAAWRAAQLRYLDAWDAVHDRGHGLGDTWSTSCSQRLSPFWDTSSRELLRQVLSTPSTTSPTQPAWSAASSQPLTLFG